MGRFKDALRREMYSMSMRLDIVEEQIKFESTPVPPPERVTQTGTPSMAVVVHPGAVVVCGVQLPPESVTVSIPVAEVSAARVDMVYLDSRGVHVVKGNPGSRWHEYSMPREYLFAAYVRVGPSSMTITQSNIYKEWKPLS